MEKNVLWLIWQDPEKRNRYKIAELAKTSYGFEFKYDKDGVKEAKKAKFELLPAFSDIDKVYENQRMFPAFTTRLPDKRRKNIKEILEKYELEEYNEFEFLKKNGGKLPTDMLEFVEPINFENNEKNFKRDFYLAGIRYYIEDIEKLKKMGLTEYERLILKKEPCNEFDECAIEVFSKENAKLGYIPKYFSKAISIAIDNNYKIDCKVSKVYYDDIRESIEVELEILIES
ncbi:MAG TPA: DNA-binding protein [Clostridiales bacterium]|nr:MAG: hypothetical protein A2Y18_06995 [Clostridiales bacterium GWD2_32_19]HCC08008.1 DNA-binding protein [Clostridiales bacterium]